MEGGTESHSMEEVLATLYFNFPLFPKYCTCTTLWRTEQRMMGEITGNGNMQTTDTQNLKT